MSMRILQLISQSVKRLDVVEITPEGNVIEIAGNNGQGKSSVLDSIEYALGGKPAATRPVRNGQDKAQVVATLGTGEGEVEYIVKRTWTHGGAKTYLTVETGTGAIIKSPQAILDTLYKTCTFEPMTFTRSDPKTQAQMLLDLAGITEKLDELRATRAGAAEHRRDIGREVKRLESTLDQLQRGLPQRPLEELPCQETDVSEVMAEHSRLMKEQMARADAETDVQAAQQDVRHWSSEIARLKEELKHALDKRAEAARRQTEARARLESLPDRSDELAQLEQKAKGAQADNQIAARVKQAIDVQHDLTGARQRHHILEEQIADLDEQARHLLDEATFPLPGLTIDAGEPVYNGVPIAQLSQAERIRIGVAVGAALNPKLRIVLIRDGAFLDSKSMQLLAEEAAARDLQVWIERIEPTGPGAIVIEDGHVREAQPKKPRSNGKKAAAAGKGRSS